MADPFLSLADFPTWFGQTLTAAQTALAGPMLQVASDRIRELKPAIADNDPAAKVVVFEIVRDALIYGHLDKLSSFQNITSRRQEAGTFDEMAKAVDDLLTGRHKALLGIFTKPAYYFGD